MGWTMERQKYSCQNCDVKDVSIAEVDWHKDPYGLMYRAHSPSADAMQMRGWKGYIQVSYIAVHKHFCTVRLLE